MKLLEAIQDTMSLEEGLQPFRLARRDSEKSGYELRIGMVRGGVSARDAMSRIRSTAPTSLVIENLSSRTDSEDIEAVLGSEMPGLESVEFNGGGLLLSEEQIAIFLGNPSIKSLTSFTIRNHTSMTDKMVRRLKRRARGRLEELALASTGITQKGLKTAFGNESWASLRSLRLHNGGQVNDVSLQALASGSFESLEELDLGACAVSEDGMRSLLDSGAMPALKRVCLSRWAAGAMDPERSRVERLLSSIGMLRLNHTF